MILAAGTTGTILATVVAFLVTSLLLISVLLFVKQKLSPSGPVKILINGEREIEVAEQEYLEILHGLNLAKLKYQDTQLSSNLKAVDLPYYPLKPMPSKRIIIIIASIMMCFIILLGTILVMEFFDNTLRNINKASEKLKIIPSDVSTEIELPIILIIFPFKTSSKMATLFPISKPILNLILIYKNTLFT